MSEHQKEAEKLMEKSIGEVRSHLEAKDEVIARLKAALAEKDEFISRIQNAAQGMMILSSGQEKMINLIEKERDRYRAALEKIELDGKESKKTFGGYCSWCEDQDGEEGRNDHHSWCFYTVVHQALHPAPHACPICGRAGIHTCKKPPESREGM